MTSRQILCSLISVTQNLSWPSYKMICSDDSRKEKKTKRKRDMKNNHPTSGEISPRTMNKNP
jgi:hypothetical protein